MKSYTDKYHLKKVEPVKSKAKISYTEYLKSLQNNEKASSLKNTAKIKLPSHRNYFQNEQTQKGGPADKPNKGSRPHTNLAPNQPNKLQTSHQFSQQKTVHRIHKSLNFKSNKDSSTGVKILTTLQGFFNKIMKSNDGCNCSEPCPWAVAFFKWVDVSQELVKVLYAKYLNKWQSSLRQPDSQSEHHSFLNDLSRKTYQTVNYYEQTSKNLKQIVKDIDRTHSQSDIFQNMSFKDRQKRILMSYATQDPMVGYVQGMNMILSGIIYHVKDQVKTYAIFRKLIQSLRNIYLHNFVECYQHITAIKGYLHSHLNDLYEMFEEIGVDLNVVCLPWVLSILTCLVPLQQLHLIYQGFIKQKWSFIYKVCLSIFSYHKQLMLDLYDAGQILSMLSATNELKSSFDWQDIIAFANSLSI